MSASPESGFSCGNHAEEGGFTGTVRADDADDGAGRDVERQVVDQQAVAKGFETPLNSDHLVAEALGGDEHFLRFVALLVVVR